MVDWGDGIVESIPVNVTSFSNLSHTYTTAGDKTVKIQGITQFYNPENISSSAIFDSFEKLIAVTDWGNIQWSSMNSMFE